MKRARTVRLAVATTLVATAASVVVTAPNAGATAPKNVSSGGSRESVIVVLKDQLHNQPANAQHMNARHADAVAAQRGVLARLSGAKPTHLINYTVGNAFSATVTTAQAAPLAADPAVASVVPEPQGPARAAVDDGHARRRPAQHALPTPASRRRPPVNPAACSTRQGAPDARARGAADDQRPLVRPHAPRPRPRSASTAPVSRSPSSPTASTRTTPVSSARTARRRSSTTRTSTATARTPPTSGAEAFGDASAIAAQGNVTYDVAELRQPQRRQLPGRPLLHQDRRRRPRRQRGRAQGRQRAAAQLGDPAVDRLRGHGRQRERASTSRSAPTSTPTPARATRSSRSTTTRSRPA